jgi:hypothetical protein
MAQATDYNLANQTGADFRAELNEILAASVSLNSGSSEPTTMYAHQLWVDTSSNVLKIRNAANNAWLTTGVSITASNTFDINAGTVNGITSLSFSSGVTVASILDEDNLSSDSATALATQQSIKAYVDSQVTAQDLDISDGSSTIAIDLDSETLSLLGGTGITSTASGNGVTFAIGQSVGTSDNVVFNQVTGALVGNASTATTLATARTISGVSFDGSANITLDTDDIGEGSSNLYYTDARFDTRLASKTTSNLTEGSNLYYTDARARASISENSAQLSYNSGTGVLTYTQGDTDTVSEGSSNLYYTDARANSAIDARVTNTFINNLSGVVADTATALATARTIALSGDVAGSVSFDGTSDVTISSTIQANSVALGTDTTGDYVATITGTANKVSVSGSGSETAGVTLSLPDDVQIADSLTVAGNLTVNGDLTYLDTTNLKIEDNLFELNANLTGSPVNDSGMLINRGNQNNGVFMWDESADKFTMGLTTADGTSTGNITLASLGTLVANLEGNVTGDVTGNVSGTAATVTGAAQTAITSVGTLTGLTVAGATTLSHSGTTLSVDRTGGATALIELKQASTIRGYLGADSTKSLIVFNGSAAEKFSVSNAGIAVTGNISNTSGDLTLDVVGDIILDADGGEVRFKDNGTEFLSFSTGSMTRTGNFTYDVSGIQLFKTNSTERMRIDASGNVGIGVTPETDWHSNYKALQLNTGSAFAAYASGTTFGTAISTNQRVTGNTFTNGNKYIASAPASLYLQQNTGIHTWYTAASGTADATISWSERMRIDSSGNLGLGTASPTSYYSGADNLVVSQASGEAGISVVTANNTTGALYFADGTSGSEQYKGGIAYTHSTDLLSLISGGASRVYIDSSGDVGISTSPVKNSAYSTVLHVHGTASGSSVRLTDANDGTATTKGLELLHYSNDSFFLNRSNGSAVFFTNNTERMRIKADGNVGIGTDNPNAYSNQTTLTINGATYGRLDIESSNTLRASLFATSGSASLITSTDVLSFDTSGGEAMRIDGSGNVLVGQTVASSGTVGASLRADGRNFFCADGNYSGHFNRNTSDGEIVHFAKDDTVVGSISAYSSAIQVGQGNVFLKFANATDTITPANGNGTNNDNAIDLGSSGARFKDLHLAGTINSGAITSSGDLTLDVEGDITLDADGGDILLKDNGTLIGTIGGFSSSDVVIKSEFSDKDLIFKGNDGGSEVTALTLDMSAGGQLKASPLGVSTPTYAFSNDSNTGMTRPTGDTLQFVTGGSERLRIDSSGHVLVGKTSGTSGNKIETDGRISAGAGSTGQPTFNCEGDINTGINLPESDRIQLITGGTERMRIDSSGKVGIANTTPSNNHANANNLVVGNGSAGGIANYVGTGLGWYAFSRDNANNTDAYDGGMSYDGSRNLMFHTNAGSERMRIDSSGVLLLKKTSTSVNVAGGYIDGGEAIMTIADAGNTYLVRSTNSSSYTFYVSGAGTVNAVTTSISSLSDERLKENIKDIDTGLSEIIALKPRNFDWKEGEGSNEKNVTGFIAQEVETVLPNLIGDFKHDDLDDAKSVKMGDMIPTLVKAIQEQQTQIEELKAEIDELKGE